KCHGGIEVRTTNVTEGVDHDRDDQTEDQPNTDVCHLATREPVDHDRSAPGKDQAEGANPLCQVGSPPSSSTCLGRYLGCLCACFPVKHLAAHGSSLSWHVLPAVLAARHAYDALPCSRSIRIN